MSTDKSREVERDEAIARWKQRHEQNQRTPEDLEQEIAKRSKYIQEVNEQRMVVAPGTWLRILGGIVELVLTIPIFFVLENYPPYNYIITVAIGFCGLVYIIRPEKVIIDRTIQKIKVQSYTFLIPQNHTIPFSDVSCISTEYKKKMGGPGVGPYDEWKVVIVGRGDIYRINRPTEYDEVVSLGDRISKFIDKDFNVQRDKEKDRFSSTKTFDGDKLPSEWKL